MEVLPFDAMARSIREHPIWAKGITTAGMAEEMVYSIHFNSPPNIVFTSDPENRTYIADADDYKFFHVSTHNDNGRNPRGPETVMHAGPTYTTNTFGFMKRNRDSTSVRQVLGIRTVSPFGDFSIDVGIDPQWAWDNGDVLPTFHYKHIPIESPFKSRLFRIRTHSFRLQIPGGLGTKEIFTWKQTRGAEIREFKSSVNRSCIGQWKLVRAATNEAVALYMSDWSTKDMGAQGYLRFLRDVAELGAEFDLVTTMSVLAALRNPKF